MSHTEKHYDYASNKEDIDKKLIDFLPKFAPIS